MRHPEQDSQFAQYPSAAYMMRHVYYLGSSGITSFDLHIVRDGSGQQNPEVPLQIPTSTYLHMFGLDELDEQNNFVPDGKFDIQVVNRLDRDEGLLYMPGVRPFSPPKSVLQRRLASAGITVPVDSVDQFFLPHPQEQVPTTLYTLAASDPALPTNRYHFSSVASGTETEIQLPPDVRVTNPGVRDGQPYYRIVDRVLRSGRISRQARKIVAPIPVHDVVEIQALYSS